MKLKTEKEREQDIEESLEESMERSMEESLAELIEKHSSLVLKHNECVDILRTMEQRIVQLEAQVNEPTKEHLVDYISDDFIAKYLNMKTRAVDRLCKEYGIPGIKFGGKVLYDEQVFMTKIKEHSK